jgi:hypothetical protein
MKSVVKFARSINIDTTTLNAMFFGYFLMVVVAGTMILKSQNKDYQSNVTATTNTQVEQTTN